MSITGISGTGYAAANRPALAPKVSEEETSFNAVLDAFMKEASKSPEQRAREKVLEKNEITEEEYSKLPPEKREAIDREIAEAVRKVHERKTGVPAEPAYFVPTDKLFR